jgi:hypothetical protein
MQFRSPNETPISVALTSGHMALVTQEGVELDQIFHREAVALGCIPDGIAAPIKTNNAKGFDRAVVIGEAMQDAIDEKNPKDFKANGTPDMGSLSKRVGFAVNRDEVDAIWAEVSKG